MIQFCGRIPMRLKFWVLIGSWGLSNRNARGPLNTRAVVANSQTDLTVQISGEMNFCPLDLHTLLSCSVLPPSIPPSHSPPLRFHSIPLIPRTRMIAISFVSVNGTMPFPSPKTFAPFLPSLFISPLSPHLPSRWPRSQRTPTLLSFSLSLPPPIPAIMPLHSDRLPHHPFVPIWGQPSPVAPISRATAATVLQISRVGRWSPFLSGCLTISRSA